MPLVIDDTKAYLIRLGADAVETIGPSTAKPNAPWPRDREDLEPGLTYHRWEQTTDAEADGGVFLYVAMPDSPAEACRRVRAAGGALPWPPVNDAKPR